ncbi:hypothetical protein [Aquabacterium sp.]|uniref:hypothetical protein n=1 Tax=Aquabacterium sp. TaxID=1872578 RepID=UPI0019AA3CD5|nr:hypothetical protein [Aquabacterium sp.]MBC7701922.1 hypothetical protein [Aquabacterium sp.]
MKRLEDNVQTVILLASLAQISILTLDHAAKPKPDEGGLVDETWNADLLMAKTMVGLIFKEKLKAPGIFDVEPLLTPSHPDYAQDSYFGGNLPTGLNVDAASGPNGGGLLHLGGTVNLAKLVAPNDQNKLGAADLDDPRKYRGWQGSVWGDYQRLRPTPELADQGRVADARFRAGALFGSEGMFILTDVGGHYSGPQAKQLTSMFFTEGLAYAPAEGPPKKVGFKVTHMSWQAEDSLAPKSRPPAANPSSCRTGGVTSRTPTWARTAPPTSPHSALNCRAPAARLITSITSLPCSTACGARCRSTACSTAPRSTRGPTKSTRPEPRRWATPTVAKAQLKSRAATVF